MKLFNFLSQSVIRDTLPPTTSGLHAPWNETEYLVLDFETTGLRPSKDHIVSFGAVPVRGGRVRPSEAIYSLVKTKRPVSGTSIKVHGIRSGDLADAPSIAEVVPVLCELLAGRVLVAHGSWIEISFLRKAFESQGYAFRSPAIDTARLVMQQAEADLRIGEVISLEYAAAAMGLPIHTPHHSLGDALTTANVFIASASKLARVQELSAADLVALSTQ